MTLIEGMERAPAGHEPDNKYFWRKEVTRKDGKEYVGWVTRKQIDVKPVLPLIESALRRNTESQATLLQRIGIDAPKWSRWQSGEASTCDIDTLDKLCLELGYSITVVYDE